MSQHELVPFKKEFQMVAPSYTLRFHNIFSLIDTVRIVNNV